MLPPESEYVPGSHARQVALLVAPTVVEYVPASQLAQLVPVVYCPAPQLTGVGDGVGGCVMGTHCALLLDPVPVVVCATPHPVHTAFPLLAE